MQQPIDREVLWEESKDLGDELVDTGGDPDKVAKAVAEFLDALVPLDLLVPGLPGMALEVADGPVLEVVSRTLGDRLKGEPDKRAERRKTRKARRAARRARRDSKERTDDR